MFFKFISLSLLILSCLGSNTSALGAPDSVPKIQNPRLPLTTVFEGEKKFYSIIQKAEKENWSELSIGERTARIAQELLGTPYVNYTLEVDDHIESPVVNLNGLDCWTFYENALAIARLIKSKKAPYTPNDLLHMVEIERYRKGRCDGSYLSRMHHLEEVFYDNQKRGYSLNITPRIPGAERIQREIREMQVQWKNYRYLKNNPKLVTPMAKIEAQISRLPIYHVPKAKVRDIEKYLQTGDICAITTNWHSSYTSHVGLILHKNGRAYFMHATSDRDKGRKTIIDRPISDYLGENRKHAGIIISRPYDVPFSR